MSRVMIYSLCLRVLIAPILTLIAVDKTVTEDETGIVVVIYGNAKSHVGNVKRAGLDMIGKVKAFLL
jgi:hypothetical protein